MITKEITLCGKQVTLAYCFATEIAYKDLANEDMYDYAKHAVDSIQNQRDPDAKRTIFAIIACMMAYYGKNLPVTDAEIMKTATPVEFIKAILTVLNMRSEFYHIPKGEPEDGQDAEKNA